MSGADGAGEDWGLDPRYQQPKKDSGMQLRFRGNTAIVTGISFIGKVEPYQMLAAAARLEQLALRMLDLSDARETQMQLQVAGRMPDEPPPGTS